jgi:uncharacterized protein
MTENRTVIVKLAEHCNLACPYCYMYTGPDQSWRTRPKRLGPAHVDLLLERSAELLQSDPAIHLTLEFHGGEPLLFGRDRFAELIVRFRARLPNERVTYCLQTNGTLLDAAWCSLFAANRVHWSISCDGPAELHDRFRPRHTGRGSHAQVEAAIRLSLSRPDYRRWFGGVLAVVDPGADARAIVHYFHALGVRDLDLLLPDATHAAAPAHLPDFSQAALTRFLADAFAAWTALDDRRFHLRMFEHMMNGFLGRRPELDAFGAGVDWLTVVESDGSYQLLDVLHMCGEEFTRTGGGLATRSLAEEFALQRGTSVPPCAACRDCALFDICGGGYLPHRFDGQGFDNPSVHCASLFATIAMVGRFLRRHTPREVWTAAPRGAA